MQSRPTCKRSRNRRCGSCCIHDESNSKIHFLRACLTAMLLLHLYFYLPEILDIGRKALVESVTHLATLLREGVASRICTCIGWHSVSA